MKMYKGFDKDLKCRGYQYQIGRTEKEESAELCERGFHACEFPMDVFGYYPPADSRFCEADQSAATNTGDYSAATVEGKESVAISLGIKGKAKGAVGCWLVLALWEQNDELDWHRVAVKSFYVDGKTIKADTFYMLNEKQEPVEVV